MDGIRSGLGQTSEITSALASKLNKITDRFREKKTNLHQKLTGIDRSFEGALQHNHMEKVVEGVHHRYSRQNNATNTKAA